MIRFKNFTTLFFLPLFFLSCGGGPEMDIHENVGVLLEKFVPTEISTDISLLPENERKALSKLIKVGSK